MVNRTFKGLHLEWLLEQKPAYEDAVAKTIIPSFLDTAFARFCRRFPIDLPLDQEPTAEFLAAVDDNAPEKESEPLRDDASDEEKAAAEVARRERQVLIRKRRNQIKHWFHYQFMKDNRYDPKSSNDNNPFGAVISALTGNELCTRPRLKTAVNTWCKTNVIEINKVVQQTVIAEKTPPGKTVAVWNRVAKQLFNLLSPEEKLHWEKKAKENHERVLAEWKSAKDKKLSTAPADRQKCIEGLVRFGQPIIEAMALATGFKITLLAGGPEPADGGRLNVISLHAGTTNGDVKLNFGQQMRSQYLEHVLPVFSEFLRGCYTTEECRARALPSQAVSEHGALEDMALDDMGASLDQARPSNNTTTLTEAGNAESEIHSDGNAPSAPPAGSTPNTVLTPNTTTAPSPTSPSIPTAPTSEEAIATMSNSGSTQTHDNMSPTPSAPTAGPMDGQSASPPRSLPPSPVPSPVVSRAPSPSGRLPSAAQVQLPSPLRSPTRRAASLSSVGTPRSITSNEVDADVDDALPSASKSLDPNTPSSAANSKKRKAAQGTDTSVVKRAHISTSLERLRGDNPWFDKAIAMLDGAGLGESWAPLVAAWILFEEKHNCKPNGALPAKGRPTAIADWIQRARSPKWRPTIKDSLAYGDDHLAWWASLQPEWRILEGDDGETDFAQSDDGDLGCLEKPGPNGLLSVVASLFFWGNAVLAAGKKSRRWNKAVDDTIFVLTRLSA